MLSLKTWKNKDKMILMIGSSLFFTLYLQSQFWTKLFWWWTPGSNLIIDDLLGRWLLPHIGLTCSNFRKCLKILPLHDCANIKLQFIVIESCAYLWSRHIITATDCNQWSTQNSCSIILGFTLLQLNKNKYVWTDACNSDYLHNHTDVHVHVLPPVYKIWPN